MTLQNQKPKAGAQVKLYIIKQKKAMDLLPQPFLFKSSSASGLTMTLYFIVCSRFFYKHPPTESLIQGSDDTSPIVRQLSFSPLLSIRETRLLLLSYPKYLPQAGFSPELITHVQQVRAILRDKS